MDSEHLDRDHRVIGNGDLITIDGEVARLVSFHRGEIGPVVTVDVNRNVSSMSLADFFGRAGPYVKGTAPQDRLEVPTTWLWHALSESDRDRIERRARDLLQVLTGSRRGLPDLDRLDGSMDERYEPAKTTQTDRLDLKSAELRLLRQEPWSKAQLYRQLAAFQQDGVLALVHGNRRLPLGLPDLPDSARTVLDEFIDEQPARPKIEVAVLAALAQARLWEAGVDITFTSSELTAVLGELTRGRALHREAKSRRNRTPIVGRTYGAMLASRPGEIVQVDATETTMHPWFPHVGRAKAYILTGIDVYTRMIVACRVVANVPTSRDVAMLLWDMGRPQITRSGWPFEYQLIRGLPRFVSVQFSSQGGQPPGPEVIGSKLGVQPTFVVLDHGRENESLHLINAAVRNGINLIYCPPGAGWTKGIVESVHRVIDTIQSLFLEMGYKGASVANHPRGGNGEESLTVGDLQDALWSYFLDVYNHTEHSGLRDPLNPALRATPQQTFETYLTVMGKVAMPTDPWRVTDFLSSEARQLEDYGINLNGLVYQSDELMDLRTVLQPGLGADGHPLDVRYDRYDLSRVYIQHPLTRQWMCVPARTGTGRAMAPFGEALLHAAIAAAETGRRGLTATERLQAVAHLAVAWSRGVFADRRHQRLAAFESTRREAWAHDLEDATPEYRLLVGGVVTPAGMVDEEEEITIDLSDYGNGWKEVSE